jgi:hypothetical protein
LTGSLHINVLLRSCSDHDEVQRMTLIQTEMRTKLEIGTRKRARHQEPELCRPLDFWNRAQSDPGL